MYIYLLKLITSLKKTENNYKYIVIPQKIIVKLDIKTKILLSNTYIAQE